MNFLKGKTAIIQVRVLLRCQTEDAALSVTVLLPLMQKRVQT